MESPDPSGPFLLEQFPAHLGLRASTVVQPAFSGDAAWYEEYAGRHDGDGREGRLLSMFTFESSWPHWEMHPQGSEVVLVVAGRLTLVQREPGGGERRIELRAGEYAVNEAGVWHTADVCDRTTAVFVTCGLGTRHEARAE